MLELIVTILLNLSNVNSIEHSQMANSSVMSTTISSDGSLNDIVITDDDNPFN